MSKANKILIIEDEPPIVKALFDKLTREGFEISVARTGPEGWEKIKAERPDLILLDIIMPEMNGWEVFEKMKAYPDSEINSIPVIIITNSGSPDDVKRGKEAGAVDYLVKADFRLKEIVEKIRKTLKK